LIKKLTQIRLRNGATSLAPGLSLPTPKTAVTEYGFQARQQKLYLFCVESPSKLGAAGGAPLGEE